MSYLGKFTTCRLWIKVKIDWLCIVWRPTGAILFYFLRMEGVTIGCKELQYLSLCSALTGLEQGRVLIVPQCLTPAVTKAPVVSWSPTKDSLLWSPCTISNACWECTPARITINKSIFVLLQPRWLEDTEYAVISYSIYGCILLVLACVVTALLVVFGNS